MKTPTSDGLQLDPESKVVLLGKRFTVVITTLSQPAAVSRVTGKTPTPAGSQVVAVK